MKNLLEKIKVLSKGKKIAIGIVALIVIGAAFAESEPSTTASADSDKPAVEDTKNNETQERAEDTQKKEENKVIYDKEGIKISFKGIDSDILGSEIKLNIENNTKNKMTVQVRDLSINGYMIDGILSSTIESGKKANDKVTVLESYLEENDIEKIEEIELKFAIIDSNDFMKTTNTDTIKIKL